MVQETTEVNKKYYWLNGNTHTKGHKLTEEHKQKISNSNKNYPELRYDITNGICLCKKHHPKKRNEEINLISTFQQIINNLN